MSGAWDHASLQRARDAHREAGELMYRLGITPHAKGYQMLRDGARLLADSERSCRVHMTYELYPSIGAAYRRNESVVEHSMREAIRVAWEREEPERQTICCEPGTPGNAAFLYALSEQLRVRK